MNAWRNDCSWGGNGHPTGRLWNQEFLNLSGAQMLKGLKGSPRSHSSPHARCVWVGPSYTHTHTHTFSPGQQAYPANRLCSPEAVRAACSQRPPPPAPPSPVRLRRESPRLPNLLRGPAKWRIISYPSLSDSSSCPAQDIATL